MNIPKYVSAEEYSRQSGIGVEQVKKLCRNGKLKHYMTEGGYYKIAVNNEDTVPKEKYEKVYERAIKAETMLEQMKKLLINE